jgi:hypothetical protein
MTNKLDLSKSLRKKELLRSELLHIAVKTIFDPWKSNYLKNLTCWENFKYKIVISRSKSIKNVAPWLSVGCHNVGCHNVGCHNAGDFSEIRSVIFVWKKDRLCVIFFPFFFNSLTLCRKKDTMSAWHCVIFYHRHKKKWHYVWH